LIVSKVKLTIIVSLTIKCIILYLFWLDYSKVAPDPYQIWGADEAHWVKLAGRISESIGKFGFLHAFVSLESITGSYHNGWPLIIGICFFLFGKNIFYVLVLKQVIYATSCYYLFKLSMISKNSFKVSFSVMTFAILYPPMLINSFSMLREEVLFGSVACFFYNLYRIKSEKNIICTHIATIIIILFTLNLRINIAVLMALFYIALMFQESSSFQKILLLLFVPVSFSILLKNYIIWTFNFANTTLSSLSVDQFFFSYSRFLFSPIPWRIQPDNHHVYNTWWYCISLSAIILSVFLLPQILISLRRHWQILLFIILYFFTYVLNASIFGDSRLSVGPRQFCIIGPLFFLITFSHIIDNLTIKNNYKNI
jgi:hypothetical protein